MSTHILTLETIADSFGVSVDDLGRSFQDFYKTLDMRYEIIEGQEREKLIVEILKNIDEDKKVVASRERTDIWYKGWQENFDDFKKNKNKESIIPKFYRPNSIIRMHDKFAKPLNPNFEVDYVKLVILYIVHRFIKSDIKNIYEFGCGTGLNLFTISKERPDVKMYGLDFVQSAVDLINEIGKNLSVNMIGGLFNMIEPDYNFKIAENSCAFTFASIEQLGNQYANFIKYLIYQKPKLCFHIEPTLDFYDDSKIMDYLAIKFHKKRGYPSNLFSHLKELENQGAITIHESKRFGFGNRFAEGYNLIVWQPK